MINNSCVYLHKRPSDGIVFYVGKGSITSRRAYRKEGRSAGWKEMAVHGFIVEIIADNLSDEDACLIERDCVKYPEDSWKLVNVHKDNRIKPIPTDIGDLVVYDENSPSFLTWRVDIGYKIKKGQPAGSISNSGYWNIETNGKAYANHRVIYFLFHGDPGNLFINHIDTNRRNNNISNLETVAPAENNRRGSSQLELSVNKNNKTGVNGVALRVKEQRACATLYVNGKRKSKTFCTKKHGVEGGIALAKAWLIEKRKELANAVDK